MEEEESYAELFAKLSKNQKKLFKEYARTHNLSSSSSRSKSMDEKSSLSLSTRRGSENITDSSTSHKSNNKILNQLDADRDEMNSKEERKKQRKKERRSRKDSFELYSENSEIIPLSDSKSKRIRPPTPTNRRVKVGLNDSEDFMKDFDEIYKDLQQSQKDEGPGLSSGCTNLQQLDYSVKESKPRHHHHHHSSSSKSRQNTSKSKSKDIDIDNIIPKATNVVSKKKPIKIWSSTFIELQRKSSSSLLQKAWRLIVPSTIDPNKKVRFSEKVEVRYFIQEEENEIDSCTELLEAENSSLWEEEGSKSNVEKTHYNGTEDIIKSSHSRSASASTGGSGGASGTHKDKRRHHHHHRDDRRRHKCLHQADVDSDSGDEADTESQTGLNLKLRTKPCPWIKGILKKE